MNVEIKLFAGAIQAAGKAIPLSCNIARQRHDRRCCAAPLAEQLPPLEPIVRRALFSINLDYASDKTLIPANAEIACIPPVSGG